MRFDPDVKHRRSVRLPGYDYTTAGLYFVTICTAGRACIFGQVIEGAMDLNPLGAIADEEWRRSALVRREVEIDAFVVMPNHVHGIIRILGPDDRFRAVGAHGGRAHAVHPFGGRAAARQPRSLGSFVAGFKSGVTSRARGLVDTSDGALWQRNYYEHIIRGPDDLGRVRAYIAANPARWSEDKENPDQEGEDLFDLWLNQRTPNNP
jgi:REP element-mobilizing transposase RayT